MKTLIIIDVQNDFIPGGALEVPEGDEIISVINGIQSHFDLIVATQDWHPQNHKSFASRHVGKNVFDKIALQGLDQILWPDHCIQGSGGAEFHHALHTDKIEAIFRKGMDTEIDSYSGFYDNGHARSTGLAGYLREKGATTLYFCGLAADFCVSFSVRDALLEGFECCWIEDATRAINKKEFVKIKAELSEQGVAFVQSRELK